MLPVLVHPIAPPTDDLLRPHEHIRIFIQVGCRTTSSGADRQNPRGRVHQATGTVSRNQRSIWSACYYEGPSRVRQNREILTYHQSTRNLSHNSHRVKLYNIPCGTLVVTPCALQDYLVVLLSQIVKWCRSVGFIRARRSLSRDWGATAGRILL